jgi:ABC-type phosphate transport system ATPase subunit
MPNAGDTGNYLVEYRDSKELFNDPQEDYTKQYLAGEFG